MGIPQTRGHVAEGNYEPTTLSNEIQDALAACKADIGPGKISGVRRKRHQPFCSHRVLSSKRKRIAMRMARGLYRFLPATIASDDIHTLLDHKLGVSSGRDTEASVQLFERKTLGFRHKIGHHDYVSSKQSNPFRGPTCTSRLAMRRGLIRALTRVLRTIRLHTMQSSTQELQLA